MASYEHTSHTLRLPTFQQEKRPAITRHDIFKLSAIFLRGVLSFEECQEFIEQAERFGLRDCGYSHNIRKSDRIAAKSTAVANVLFERIRPYLEDCVDLRPQAALPRGVDPKLPQCQWYPVGLNECFRLCRYEPGGFFKPHYDYGFDRSPNERSIKTFMIYLNNDFSGGDTNFYNSKQRHYEEADAKNIEYSFRPKAGDALIFNSSITHDGGQVLSGRKYIMRSEIMYSRDNMDLKAFSHNSEPDHDDFDIEDFKPDSDDE